MARTVGIGIQDFGKLIEHGCFYIDKTEFIRDWWESMDDVTLITRPRRFGKTLNMSMTEQFFSINYKNRSDLFEGLDIWKHEKYRTLQGTYPVVSISFANVKEKDYQMTRKKICQLLTGLFAKHAYLLESGLLYETEVRYFKRVSEEMDDSDASMALHQLSDFLHRYYKKNVIILLDEYDTPMQEAFVNGYWDELAVFTRNLFHAAFKTNPWLERALMTGITRVGKESIFSDLNNLEVITSTSEKYAVSFGFTEEEVSAALDEYGLSKKREEVKRWYNGFVFGKHPDVYNPWSILNFLDKSVFAAYWANTSSNRLVSRLVQRGNRGIKEKFERLLRGDSIQSPIDEQIVYNQLNGNARAVWSLLLAGGYLKVLAFESYLDVPEGRQPKYDLALTNLEVKLMFQSMIKDWFTEVETDYNDFIKALLSGDIKAMNAYMNRVALGVFSYFDTGRQLSLEEPERFYHGFVLGLIVELQERYVITSNRESGFGRYDVMLEPKNREEDDGIILEFKVYDPEEEKTPADTVRRALKQIEAKQYAASLTAAGVPAGRIRSYGFAFRGKQVLIGDKY